MSTDTTEPATVETGKFVEWDERNIEVSEWVLDQIMNRVELEDGGTAWYINCEEGYMVVWSDGNHHHTYHDPANWLY